MASEITAAQYGAHGTVRRDPMAMLPFCGYNMADYFRHWLNMGKIIKNQPKIFHVNWFRTDKNGQFIWPGYGENLRVLEWIIERCSKDIADDTKAIKTPIGYVPSVEDLDLEGLDISKSSINELLKIDNSQWLEEAEQIREFYSQFKEKLPNELNEELNNLIKRLKENK